MKYIGLSLLLLGMVGCSTPSTKSSPSTSPSSASIQSVQDEKITLVEGEDGFVFVDIDGNVLDYRPFIFDNAPDMVSEGLMRIQDSEGKMGYADSLGHIVIEPQFFFALPFEDGYGRVALEGTFETVGEHTKVKVDKWMKIDKEGNLTTLDD